MTSDRTALRDFLLDWAEGREIETHAARVYLGETTALKLKRCVRYAYLDFTDREVRKQVLERELALNRPMAPQIYRDVVPITRAQGRFAIDGPGDVVEWALRMWRFPSEAGLDQIAARGAFTDDLADTLGQAIHDLHDKCPPLAEDGAVLAREVLDGFAQEFDHLQARGLKLDVAPVLDAAAHALERWKALLTDRSGDGFVRRCHGDLHLRNLVVLDDRPVPFDALEFSDRLATCDVLYDLAFLLMDMTQRGLSRQANRVLNAYFEMESLETALTGLAALPLFIGLRALVRAVVSADLAASGSAPDALAEARRYVAFADHILPDPTPVLYVVAGLSGTGKTTLARRIAPELPGPCGALILRSDIERKRAAGVAPQTRLPAEAYSPAQTEMVYGTLLGKADIALKSGMSVILDAVFARPAEREAAEALARRHDIAFRGLWLEAPEPLRGSRIEARRGDASDATAEVVQQQSLLETGPITWESWETDEAVSALVSRILDGAVS
ncbi:MAG: AAA family ATPase [Pseudomonadota bacterium]